MDKRLLFGFIVCLFVLSVSADAEQDAFEAEVVRLVNIERVKRCMEPLEISKDLQISARIKAEEFVTYKYFDHDSPVSGEFSNLIEAQTDEFYYYMAENIAQGHKTPQQVVDSWMDSPGHKSNILDFSFTHIGVGYCQGNWVQHFGMKSK